MRENNAPLQAEATELASAIMAEEEELLLLRAQVRPLMVNVRKADLPALSGRQRSLQDNKELLR